MKKHFRRRVFILAIFALAAVSIVTTKAFCRCGRSLDTRGWRLPDLVTHLHERGVRFQVIPSRADGKWDDTVYLTTDTDATWQTFQRKNMSPERIRQWYGAVWVHRIGPNTDVEGRLLEWQGHGCRVDNFLVFGDAVLIGRIREAVPNKATR